MVMVTSAAASEAIAANSKRATCQDDEVLEAWMGYQCRWDEELSAEVCYFQGFIKHPPDIPLDCAITSSQPYINAHVSGVHEGGMVFEAQSTLPIGAKVMLTVNLNGADLALHGVITHCIQVADNKCDVGVQFEQDNEHYAMRMIEQACHIEHYRRIANKRGRSLSEDEAAQEWIAKYAASFPR